MFQAHFVIWGRSGDRLQSIDWKGISYLVRTEPYEWNHVYSWCSVYSKMYFQYRSRVRLNAHRAAVLPLRILKHASGQASQLSEQVLSCSGSLCPAQTPLHICSSMKVYSLRLLFAVKGSDLRNKWELFPEWSWESCRLKGGSEQRGQGIGRTGHSKRHSSWCPSGRIRATQLPCPHHVYTSPSKHTFPGDCWISCECGWVFKNYY